MISVDVNVDFNSGKYKSKADSVLKSIKPKIKLQIAKDCNSNAPLKTNALRNSAIRSAAVNDDYIRWDTPYAHFQHEGRVMIGEHSHSPWAKHGEKKIYTGRMLTYTNGGSKWVEKTMGERLSAWVDGARALFKKAWG